MSAIRIARPRPGAGRAQKRPVTRLPRNLSVEVWSMLVVLGLLALVAVSALLRGSLS
jgi:hypothetical protein